MKGENRKRIFARKNALFALIPGAGFFLILLASLIFSVLSVPNRVAEACLSAAIFVFLAWLIFGICYLSLRGKSGKKKVFGIALVAIMCTLLACCIALTVWNNAVYAQIEQLRAISGNSGWSAATAEELSRAETLYETLLSTISLLYMAGMFVVLIGGAFLRDWRCGEDDNPLQEDIKRSDHLQ